MSREWLALADQIDLFVQVNTAKGKRPRPFERPWSATARRARAVDPELKLVLLINAGRG